MRLIFVKKLIKLMIEMDVSEIEIRRFGTSIRVSKNSNSNAKITSGNHEIAEIPEPGALNKKEMVLKADRAEKRDGIVAIKCPMVGTFYRAPAPDAPPYVEVGDHVRKGQIVCIVEAMKIMNEIESDVSGAIVEVAAKNEDPVEFNQELFLVKQK